MPKKKFPGFSYPERNYYLFPKALDGYIGQLTGNEFKVLAYIIRKTWGFNKVEDKISYRQFLSGIVTKDGVKVFDGLGMHRDTLVKCLKSLAKKGFIEIIREEGNANVYRLRYGEIPTPPKNSGGSPPKNSGGTPPKNSDIQYINNNNRYTIKGGKRNLKAIRKEIEKIWEHGVKMGYFRRIKKNEY